MRIVMMTNTYKPIIGGLERSVEIFSREYRKRGHDVIIVTPEHKGAPEKEEGVFRVPAIQNFNGTDFPVELPIHLELLKELDEFQPEIVHTHHPFFIGDTALRVSERYETPLVFTHHTLYEEYTHYVPLKAKGLKEFVINLATEYANLCDYVFAPSQSIASLMKDRGVKTEIEVVPTGIYAEEFSKGDGRKFREKLGINKEDFVVGTVGRMAPEKNIEFLTEAIKDFLNLKKQAHFLVVGSGKSLEFIKETFEREGLNDRLHCPGSLKGQELIDAYHSMDAFAFASHSETQGLVLLEAMDRVNGRLIERDDKKAFCDSLGWVFDLPDDLRLKEKTMAKKKADEFSVMHFVAKALKIYEALLQNKYAPRSLGDNPWLDTLKLIRSEIKLAKTFTKATAAALNGKDH